jgi:acetylornithine/LysW-gamma-L-lysine aminotransferase
MTTPTISTSRAVEARYTSGVYGKREVTLVRGEGAVVWDDHGNQFIDCTAGYGCANIGHAHPALVQAISRQAATLISCQEAFYNDRRAELLQELNTITPESLDRFFLCNSGTEANEAALKFARLATGRTGIVAAQRGFHGRTMGALSATWEAAYRQPFEPLLPNVRHVPFDRLEVIDEAIDDSVGAVILEAVQGEGGVRPAGPGYLAAVSAICRERGALLIVDEVQTGFGRTGRMFACEHVQVVPDLMTMGKSIAGGVPMGAVAIGPRVQGLKPGAHGSTFGGNPLACAASIATIGVLRDERLPERAAAVGAHMFERLRSLDAAVVREVRGLGLLIGIELRDRVRPVLAALQERGVLALPAGATTLRLLPPLVIDDDQVERALTAIEETLSGWRLGKQEVTRG